jgi:hypothetical protein
MGYLTLKYETSEVHPLLVRICELTELLSGKRGILCFGTAIGGRSMNPLP